MGRHKSPNGVKEERRMDLMIGLDNLADLADKILSTANEAMKVDISDDAPRSDALKTLDEIRAGHYRPEDVAGEVGFVYHKLTENERLDHENDIKKNEVRALASQLRDKARRLRDVVKVSAVAVLLITGTAHAEIGKASWYSYESCVREGTSGVFTASGERFNHDDMTCASWNYPMGTTLQVTNQKTGRSVVVRVNDRGPGWGPIRKGVVIDLSKGAFKKIADLKSGVVPVMVELANR